MKKLLFVLPFVALLAACGEKEPEKDEVVVLEDFADRIGYALGSINAESMKKGQIPSFDKLDINMICEGFEKNLNETNCDDCDDVLRKLFGPYGQDFDTTYLKEGSECMGRTTALAFFTDMQRMNGLEKVDLEMVKAGFRYSFEERDTLIAEQEKRQMIQDFITDLNTSSGEKMMADAAARPGVEVFENGIILETIEEGTGGMPGVTDDVEVQYILTSSEGDTIQSSIDMGRMRGNTDPTALSLDGGVIPGWSYALPKMKKGGKYRTWIPWELAYGAQGGKQSLCFYIELVNYGPKGSLYTPPPAQGAQY
ncbi:MAG: FKBP-type peptidyl-prolyl cis-trans isomerase [Crocinitomicaceae bacterium]|nr:FKBP-type peptidyl-prolyl cis-trans isomerase [Crocinitomicaceae bacterium]